MLQMDVNYRKQVYVFLSMMRNEIMTFIIFFTTFLAKCSFLAFMTVSWRNMISSELLRSYGVHDPSLLLEDLCKVRGRGSALTERNEHGAWAGGRCGPADKRATFVCTVPLGRG